MSSFLVEDKTINTIVEYIANERDLDYIRRKIKARFNCDLETYEGKEALANYMFKMNCKATGERYSESAIGLEDFRPLNFKYQCQPFYNQFSALKSLSCWLYQCAEGEVAESQEYKFFEELQGDIAYHIVCRLPEYEKIEGWN